jgi:hypothetical protein
MDISMVAMSSSFSPFWIKVVLDIKWTWNWAYTTQRRTGLRK